MVTLGLAVVALLLFLAGVAREPRSFGNAVLLGLALALGALALAARLAAEPGGRGHPLLLALLLAVAVGPFLLGCFLLANGVVLIRREGLRPANLLSLLTGGAAVAVVGLDVAADQAAVAPLSLLATIVNLLFGYVSFLLVSYVCYAFGYGRLARAGRAGVVIVLGAGLSPRSPGGVPPLLASRLNRGHAVWTALDRQAAAGGGDRPLLIVSGGKGDDERESEAAAMARYLERRGFPASLLALEDKSRNTEENLRLSRAIMSRLRPGARAVIVTSDFHALRAALIARQIGLPAQATGAPAARYYEPNAVLREFAAVFLRFRLVNLAICAILVAGPLIDAALH